MLSVNSIKLIIFANRPAWKNYANDTYCHWRTYRDNYKHLVQSIGYSTKCNEKKNNAPSLVDPRVEALREKLIYCDYLDRNKTKIGYLKRVLAKRRIHRQIRQARLVKLTNVPVYSVLLDAKNNQDNDENDSRDSRLQAEEYTNPNESVTRPVHMPYASTDQYSNVDASGYDPNERDFDESQIPLNERYKVLYDKYLAAKNAVSGEDEEPLDLEGYLEAADADILCKNDMSNVPPNWMADYEEYNDTLWNDTWLNNYGTPDPSSSVSSVPCGGCGALLHCKDHAIPGYLPSELFLNRSEQELKVMICQRCHFMKYYSTMLEVKVSADEYPRLLQVIRTKKCAVILLVDLTDFPCSIWPEINSVLHPRTSVFVVGNKVDLLPQDSPRFFDHVKQCLSKAVEDTGIKKKSIRHVALISAKTSYGVEELINKLHSLWKYKGKSDDDFHWKILHASFHRSNF